MNQLSDVNESARSRARCAPLRAVMPSGSPRHGLFPQWVSNATTRTSYSPRLTGDTTNVAETQVRALCVRFELSDKHRGYSA